MSALLARTSAAAAAVLLGVAGCTRSSPPHASPSPSLARHSATDRPARFSPGLTGCGTYGTPYSRAQLPDPGAPAYTGAGPHPAVVGEFIGPDAKSMIHITPSTFSLPTAWQALNAGRTEADPSRAQLIVCLSEVAGRAGGKIGTCRYDRAQADVYPVGYTFDIYTARTGRRVARLTVASDETAPASCPASVVTVGNTGFRVAQGMSDAAFLARLRPILTGPAR